MIKKTIFTFTAIVISVICFANIIKSNATAKFIQLKIEAKEITAQSYVQDGLIAQYDGIENAGYGIHDENATSWKDLVGDNDAIIAGNVYFIENAIHRDPTSSAKIFIPNIPIKQGFTIEYCSIIYNLGASNLRDISTTSNKRLEYIKNSNGNLSLYYRNYNETYVSRALGKYIISPENTTTSIGFDDKGVIFSINGSNPPYYDYTVNTPMSNDFYGNQTLSIGSFSTLYENANYYSIRIYNRPLTAQEVSHNAKIDQIRFQ